VNTIVTVTVIATEIVRGSGRETERGTESGGSVLLLFLKWHQFGQWGACVCLGPQWAGWGVVSGVHAHNMRTAHAHATLRHPARILSTKAEEGCWAREASMSPGGGGSGER
jgi:hypothetical protein